MAKRTPATLVYQLHIRLIDSKPDIWCRILVPVHFDLHNLHYVIQNAFEWNHEHLFQFCQGDPWGEVLYPPSDEDGSMVEPDDNGKYPPAPSLHEVLKVGESLFYVYDFGDSWEHEIYCEALMVKPPKIRLPHCVDGANHAAFENCGGVYGYAHILTILSNRDNPAYQEELAELTDYYTKRILKYDPTAFDPKKLKL